jgi:gluconate 2-dehydrogenase gamma chain
MSIPIDRRSFIKSAAGSTVVLASMPALAAATNLASGCKFFNPAQAATVEAIAEQFVPQDDAFGARQAGVLFYIDGLLIGKFGRFYVEHYQSGFRLMNQLSQKQFHHDFSGLAGEQQLSLLQALESGTGAGAEGQRFFALILQHTMQGYYGDPEHGGNRGSMSWKMIGFEG